MTTVSQDIPGMVSAATELLLTRIAAAQDEPLAPRRVVSPRRWSAGGRMPTAAGRS